jgi:NADH-quinone oxidoreductase subunit M
MLRFVLPLFPQAALDLAPVAMVLGVVGILYGALLAFGQTDLKRFVAYTSVSHMGFVLLGTFTGSRLALQGVVMQMICHGISTSALFALVGALQERTHTRDMRRMGGLWSVMPRFGGVALLFALAGMGLPGLGNFIGEFLVLLGTYAVSPLLTVLAALGLVGATVYALWFIQVTFHGPNREGWSLPDLSARETLTAGALILAIVWLGIYPQPVFDTADGALRKIQQAGAVHPHPAPEGAIQADEPGEGGPSAAHAALMSRHETGTPHTEQTDGAR